MKRLIIWILNVAQFLIVYLLCYALYFYGILEIMPEETGLNLETIWPIASIGTALALWKIYTHNSNYIIAKIMNTEIPKIEITKRPKRKPSKLLYTFFFGYASLKWRRLFRTLIMLPTFAIVIVIIYQGIDRYNWKYKEMEMGINEKGEGKSPYEGSPNFGRYYYYLEQNLEPYKKNGETGIYGYIEELQKDRNEEIGRGLLCLSVIFIFFGLISWLIQPFVVKNIE